NEVRTFLDESCVTDAEAEDFSSISTQELHRAYMQWARDRGAGKMSAAAFTAEMVRLGFEPAQIWSKRNKSTRWRGVRLRGAEDGGPSVLEPRSLEPFPIQSWWGKLGKFVIRARSSAGSTSPGAGRRPSPPHYVVAIVLA